RRQRADVPCEVQRQLNDEPRSEESAPQERCDDSDPELRLVSAPGRPLPGDETGYDADQRPSNEKTHDEHHEVDAIGVKTDEEVVLRATCEKSQTRRDSEQHDPDNRRGPRLPLDDTRNDEADGEYQGYENGWLDLACDREDHG